MEYATAYDVGDHKRGRGINEDSLAVVLCDGPDAALRGSTRLPDTVTGDPPPVEALDRSPAERVDALLDSSSGTVAVEDAETPLVTRAEEAPGTTDDEPPTGHDGSASPENSAGTPAGCEGARTDLREDYRAGGSGDRSAGQAVAVFGLADGAGGHEAGDVASAVAATVVVEHLAKAALGTEVEDRDSHEDGPDPLSEAPTAGECQRAVADAIDAAHREVLAYAGAAETTAFTTVVAGIALDGELHYGWVGDSRIYVVNAVHGAIERLTADHSVVADLADAGEIDPVEAMVHPRSNEITRALGGRPESSAHDTTVTPETNTVGLYADDVVLFASDGLFDAQTDASALHDRYLATRRSAEVEGRIRDEVITDDEIRDAVLSAESLAAAVDDLLALANGRGGKDNISAILFRDPDGRETPSAGRLPARAIHPDDPVEERQTVVRSGDGPPGRRG